MILSGSQTEQIQRALLQAFNRVALEQLTRSKLDQRLEDIAGGGSTTETVFKLIEWADRHGQVQTLIQGAHEDNPHHPDLIHLVAEMRGWQEVQPPEEGVPPYQGLLYFDVGDADRFFGRERLTAELADYLRAHQFLAVIGASGSGKSSLVRAGLIPALRAGRLPVNGYTPPDGCSHWPIHIITPKAHPLKELATSLTAQADSVIAAGTLRRDMLAEPNSLDLYATRLLQHNRANRLLLVVDQFEELFTQCKDERERQAFVDNLITASAPDSHTTLVLTLRADFYHHCSDFDGLRQAVHDQIYIGPMRAEELRQAIEKPAAAGGWELEPTLTDLMLEDVANEPGGLPLLSHALLETWKRRRGRTLLLRGYRSAGGVKGAIAHTADEIYQTRLHSDEERAIARNIFLRLTSLGEGSQDTRRRVALAEFLPSSERAEMVRGVLKTLADARLITTDRDEQSGQEEAEVAHEALIREWKTLSDWLQDDREGLRTHRHLTESTQAWLALEKDRGELYRGIRLDKALEWAEDHADDLNEFEKAFLNASVADRQQQLEEKERNARQLEEARQRELKDAQALAVAAEQQRQTEAARTREAEARQQAETERAQEAEARQQVEQQRAMEAEQSASNLRRRAYYLGAALVAALLAIATTYYFFIESRNKAEEAAQSAEVAGARLTQFGQVVGGLGADRLQEIIQELVQSGDKDGALILMQTAVESNPELQVDIQYQDTNEAIYVYIPAREFMMGSDQNDSLADSDEFPQHTVMLDGYWIQQTEVTKAQYRRCMEQGPCTASGDSRLNDADYGDHPVVDVVWNQARVYAEWVGGRLPTEAEWEKACRGAEGRIYPWGDADPDPTQLNYYESGLNEVVQVGSYPAGVNGLYDMAGNVWEWTSSKYQEYPYDPTDGREDPEGDASRTLRGGSFAFSGYDGRCAYRLNFAPTNGGENLGFRVVVRSPGS